LEMMLNPEDSEEHERSCVEEGTVCADSDGGKEEEIAGRLVGDMDIDDDDVLDLYVDLEDSCVKYVESYENSAAVTYEAEICADDEECPILVEVYCSGYHTFKIGTVSDGSGSFGYCKNGEWVEEESTGETCADGTTECSGSTLYCMCSECILNSHCEDSCSCIQGVCTPPVELQTMPTAMAGLNLYNSDDSGVSYVSKEIAGINVWEISTSVSDEEEEVECGGGEYCRCVECVLDEHCPDDYTCERGVCMPQQILEDKVLDYVQMAPSEEETSLWGKIKDFFSFMFTGNAVIGYFTAGM